MTTVIKVVFAVILWCSTALGAEHHHHGHRSAHVQALAARVDDAVVPFRVGFHLGQLDVMNRTNVVSDFTAYLVGSAPDPAHLPQGNMGFIAQHNNDGTTGYFFPRDSSPDVAINTSGHRLNWKVKPTITDLNFTTPGTIISGRIYVSQGPLDFFAGADGTITQPDPNNGMSKASSTKWGFVELTHSKDPSTGKASLTVNLSFVDWVSLPLGMKVTYQEQGEEKVATIPGLKPDGLVNICNEMTRIGGFWPRLCQKGADGEVLRVMSPMIYTSLFPNDTEASTYYDPYVTTVWDTYTHKTVQINIQAQRDSDAKVDNGVIVTCSVKNDLLSCDNDAGDFVRPVSKDIFGCNSGPFANPQQGETETWARARVRPRLCAAFVRSTLHLEATQPARDDLYYKYPITNHYARAVHENLIGGMGYAFSYDDVNANSSQNTAGLLSMEAPVALDIMVNSQEEVKVKAGLCQCTQTVTEYISPVETVTITASA